RDSLSKQPHDIFAAPGHRNGIKHRLQHCRFPPGVRQRSDDGGPRTRSPAVVRHDGGDHTGAQGIRHRRLIIEYPPPNRVTHREYASVIEVAWAHELPRNVWIIAHELDLDREVHAPRRAQRTVGLTEALWCFVIDKLAESSEISHMF